MSISSALGRRVIIGTAATAAIAIGAAPAMAHHCFIPMYSLSAPTSSNWLVFSAQDGAGLGGYEAVTVDVRPDPALRARASDLGVEVGPVSLQTLVVRAGVDSPTHAAPTGVPSSTESSAYFLKDHSQ